MWNKAILLLMHGSYARCFAVDAEEKGKKTERRYRLWHLFELASIHLTSCRVSYHGSLLGDLFTVSLKMWIYHREYNSAYSFHASVVTRDIFN